MIVGSLFFFLSICISNFRQILQVYSLLMHSITSLVALKNSELWFTKINRTTLGHSGWFLFFSDIFNF